jgi:hypothetical protein
VSKNNILLKLINIQLTTFLFFSIPHLDPNPKLKTPLTIAIPPTTTIGEQIPMLLIVGMSIENPNA